MKKGVNKANLGKYSRREFIIASAVTGVSIAVLGCSKSKEDGPGETPKTDDNFHLTGVVIPKSIAIQLSADFSLQGKGFAVGDKISFTPLFDGKAVVIDVKSVTEGACLLRMPSSFVWGSYRISVTRGEKNMTLGDTKIEMDIPDKTGMTVKGMVYATGVGLAGVIVSDGIEVTRTDENGIYYLPSKKTKDFVFVSIPGGYEVNTSNGILPVFYKHFELGSNAAEAISFELKAVDNDKHVVLALGDMHLANRNNDVSQFQNGFLRDAAQSITQYRNEGYKVYGLTLGDMTWDAYWYSNKYSFSEYLDLVKNMGLPVFHTMGNHDNDPYINSDWPAESAFRKSLGPTYYSFNLGKVHYIVLDNIQYVNMGGAQGTVGSRNYNAVIVAEQIAWLKKDLAMIADKSTPIVIAMHIQLNNSPKLSGGNETSTYRLNNGAELVGVLDGFTDVNLITGHTHVCYAYENNNNIMEHNSGAICATWWWTGKSGYAGNHISKDGAPGGYGVWKFNGKSYQWRYKSIGYKEEYQFRAYDLNKVHITAAKFAPNSTDAALKPYAGEYANVNSNNEILVNVWGYDKRWTIEMFENNAPLTVNRIEVLDPLHIVSYEALRLNAAAEPTEDFVTGKTAHMFKAKASNATNPILIKVTDRFGNVYLETMNRPKDFILSMS
ncbi:metallophosphoesterase [Pseudopedobacter saltans DSM 12145]|uniref:Metallophosphoesterase n=1 Tax=Pseudopedobacter saltans (strain ATCC 51119 / DSM 12145 / JCM 21818 / CCUG 39354 / LMG 10337 / NBRC 100064 / NCIMB 13643) TaxID=762903 RepID=F0SB88_PSESL|nr:calcineurin-like phosphoesterase family protein [Pseudopedobacter saltans]ADY53715.1 metallophosphoesterase [Pseudopedobacter saltans DSM 12145]